MPKYRKKPIIIEAEQWFKIGDHSKKVVRRFRHPNIGGNADCRKCGKPMYDHGWIDTLEGVHNVCPGDWIITGVKGEFYPCKPDIFEQTYESV